MLGFLSNMRDVKGALTAGLMLLFALWVALGNEISRIESDDTMLGTIAKLVTYLGPVATLGVVTFCGYLLGLALSFDALVLGTIHSVFRWRYLSQGKRGKRFRLYIEGLVEKATRHTHPYLISKQLGDEVGLKRLTSSEVGFIDGASAQGDMQLVEEQMPETLTDGRERLTNELLSRIHENVRFLAVQLDDKARDRFEKSLGEAEFRASVSIPLVVLGVVCGTRMSIEGSEDTTSVLVVFAGFFVAGVMAWLAARKEEEAWEEVHNKIALKQISVSDLDLLKQG